MSKVETENILDRYANPRKFFSEEQVQKLIKDYSIDEMSVDELLRSLCSTAEIYVWNLDFDEPRPARHELQSDLKQLQSNALRLVDLMGKAPPIVRHLVERSNPMDDGEEMLLPFSYEGVMRTLGTFAERAGAAVDEAPGMPKGKRASHALGRWADGMKVLFEKKLNRKFTIVYDGDKPDSIAAQFSVEALQMIFPKVKSRQIITALRTARKD